MVDGAGMGVRQATDDGWRRRLSFSAMRRNIQLVGELRSLRLHPPTRLLHVAAIDAGARNPIVETGSRVAIQLDSGDTSLK